MPTTFFDLPIATLEKALALRKQIEALQSSVNEILGGGGEASAPSPVIKDGRKGKRSAAARAKMAAAQKARWAKRNGAATMAAPVKAGDGAKPKRVVSAASRAKMAAAQKARWAKKNGASPAPAKAVVDAPRKKRTMSPEAREKIAAAQRARWAKQKAA
jgi:hypothetical protein